MDWYDNYSIGDDLIDSQHKKLVETVDKLQKSLKSSNINAEMAETLKFVANYTQQHFSDEEKLMQSVNFPDYEKHKMLHKKLLAEVVEILVNIKKGKPINAYELIDFLVDWLKTHIINEDHRIAKYITAKKKEENK